MATMPEFRPFALLRGGHWQTIYPTLFRPLPPVSYKRERVTTPDGDFLDIDWAASDSDRLVVVCHGLESSSNAKYVRGMVRACNLAGWDVAAMNLRGCSGEPNRLPRSYHSGATEDLAAVLHHALDRYLYKQVVVLGFSLGGNIVLKMAGDRHPLMTKYVTAAVGISVPCDLEAGARQLERSFNALYQWRFVRGLKEKVLAKCQKFADRFQPEKVRAVTSVREFDEVYTAPVHGFANATDYYRRCSCKPLLAQVPVPTLLINAEDDPFLPAECYPWREAQQNPLVTLLVPRWGGHVGFVDWNRDGLYWHERCVLNYLSRLDGPEPVGSPAEAKPYSSVPDS